MVRRHYWSWFFRLPYLRRFDGFCLTPYDIVIRPEYADDKVLLAHELCHVYWWRIHPITFPLSYLIYGYKRNPFESLAEHQIPHKSYLFKVYGGID